MFYIIHESRYNWVLFSSHCYTLNNRDVKNNYNKFRYKLSYIETHNEKIVCCGIRGVYRNDFENSRVSFLKRMCITGIIKYRVI